MSFFRRLNIALFTALFSAWTAHAAVIFIRERTAAAYTGPGDVVSGARVWYGLRGYNAAYATGTHNGVNIQVGANTYDIKILENGNLDVTTALTDAGITGTGTCTISGTTMVCATGTGTFTQYGNITGGGLSYPAYQTSVNCSSFPCTITLNAAQTIAVGETITGYNQIAIREWYDQSGASACSGACNIGPASGRTNYLIAQCQNGQPCVFVANISSNSQYLLKTGMTSTNTPLTYSLVASRTTNFTSLQSVISLFNATSGQGSALWSTTTNKFGIFCSAVGVATASNSVVHAIQATGADASAAVLNIDGTETTGLNCGTGAASTVVTLFNDNGTDLYGQGNFMEAGMWPSNLGATNRGLLCHNQFVYWGTGTSC